MAAFSNIIRAGKKIYEGGKSTPAKPMAGETIPPRQQRRADPAISKPSTSSRAKANQAADMLGVPGAKSARTLRDKTRRVLEEMGE